MQNNNIRIAFVGDGNSANVRRWIIGLQKVGCKIYLISFEAEQANSFAKTFSIPFPKIPGKLHYILASWSVKRIMNAIDPDLVIGYSASGYGILAGLASSWPLVISVTGSDLLDNSLKRIPVKLLSRMTLKKADLITAWEKHMQKAVINYGINKNKIFVLPSGIDVGRIKNQSKDVNKTQNIGIISTRSLHKLYNLDILLEAFKRTKKKDLQLTFAGNGTELDTLKRNAMNLGISERVKFVGFIDNNRIGKILSKNHIYISLSPRDGVSASLLEAMAAGLLPIVYDNDANRFWIKNNENGILLKSIKAEYVAKKIDESVLMMNQINQIAEYNYKLVKNKADLHNNSKKYVEIFKELLKYK